MLQLTRPASESLEQRLFTALDAEHGDAYRRLHLTIMLATRFASATVRRKGHVVTVLYLHALGTASSPAGRERRWRRFVRTASSLGVDLRLAHSAPHHPTLQAQAELDGIVAENGDLLAAAPPR